jgi:endonuclease/exonuclease/phosphatase (EEP) superfamily protein YafD
MVGMWILGGLVVLVAAVSAVSVRIRWCPGPAVAMVQLLTPWWTVLTLVVAVVAALQGHWVLMGVALVVLVGELVVLAPKLRRSPRQDRAEQRDPALALALANLYLDNDEPDEAIRQLLDAAPDVLMMTELTDDLLERFDALGGAARYPDRVHHVPLDGEYEAGIFSSLPFVASSVWNAGELQVVEATVRIDQVELRVIAVHPEAPTGRDAFRRWRSQLGELGGVLADSDGPTIAVGDLNSGTLQPPYERLFDTRFRDAHDELGVALRPSWGVAPWLPRWFPTLVARLDHLLVSPEVEITSLDDLDPVGSDHRPFVAELTLTTRR